MSEPAKKQLKERKTEFRTPSDLLVERFYEYPSDVANAPVLPKPGSYPYTRGIHETMYRSRLWTMRQYAGFGTAREANERYRYLLSQGTTGLSVAFDLPTQMGRDPDHPLVKGEVGRVGVSIATVEDMKVLLEGIPLEQVSISMTINATAAMLLALLLLVAEEQGVPWERVRGTIQNDVLKEYIARGTYIYPPREALRIITDIFSFCKEKTPEFNTISISGYHIREAGSTAVEEVAFTLADGIAYVEAALEAGLQIDEFAPRLAFFFNCHNNFLEEIAKFRAARTLWATIMRERFQAKNPQSLMLRFHTQTAGSSLTAQQPLNNIMRTTIQALAAVLGGTQSLHTNSYDEALGLPTEESALIALRTQQVIASESGIADVVDPLGGAPLLESWTQRIIEEASLRLEKIDEMGGMLRAIEAGYPQEQIETSAYRYQQKIESGELEIVGVNRFVGGEEKAPPVLKIDPTLEREAVARVQNVRATRNPQQFAQSLERLERAVQEGGSLMPALIEAFRARATLGEVSDVLRKHFGEYREKGMWRKV